MHRFPRIGQVYIWLIILGGALITILLLPTAVLWPPQTWLLYLIFLLAATMADIRPVHLTYRARVSIGDAVCFAGWLLFGVGFGGLVAAASNILSNLLLKHPWYRTGFNAGKSVISVTAAGLVYFGLAGPTSNTSLAEPQSVATFLLAALVHVALDTWLVALVIAFTRRRSPWHVWFVNVMPVLPQSVSIPLLGALAAELYRASIISVLLLAIPLIVVHLSLQVSQELRVQTKRAIEALADTIDKRDPYTFDHSSRVARYAERIATAMRLPDELIDQIADAARIHDLGKMGITNAILYKPDSLDPKEREDFQRHPVIGAEIVGRFPLYREGKELILYHHEHFDGSGYPHGLAGDLIPIGARIIAVADAFDAMTSDRPYRKALAYKEAIEELRRCAGTQFDPKVIEVFIQSISKDVFQSIHTPTRGGA